MSSPRFNWPRGANVCRLLCVSTQKPACREIAVTDIVELVMPSGDLQSSFRMRQLAEKGIDAHETVRASRPEGYQREVSVSYTAEAPDFTLCVRGRIDGVLRRGSAVTIEEIKTTLRPLALLAAPERERHLAQARLYGFMYCTAQSLDGAEISLTYFSIPDAATRTFSETMDLAALSAFFDSMTDSYRELLRWERDRITERDQSLRALAFPFRRPRDGQEQLMREVERAIRDDARLFARAATGIGKTMSVLFPSVKALAEGGAARIFYLTARGTAREMAEKSLLLLQQRGAKIRFVTITAKAKACLLSRDHCLPEDCPFALGFYDRLGDALREARDGAAFTEEAIRALARRHTLCPFELSLELSLSADCIICDYNYLFDARVALQRFFAQPRRDSVLLIDEAHNLIERVRSIHSASLSRKAVLAARRAVSAVSAVSAAGSRDAARDLKELGDALSSIKKGCREDGLRFRAAEDPPRELIELVEKARASLAPAIQGDAALLDFHSLLLDFIRVGASYGPHATTADCGGDTTVSLLCLDPARYVREALDKGKAAVCFSATLSPSSYYVSALGGDPGDAFLDIPSPFPAENLLVMIDAGVSTRLLHRASTIGRVVEDLEAFTSQPGNYMAFFPSYAYMAEALVRFQVRAPGVRTMVQEQEMLQEARDAFVGRFVEHPREPLVGFAVLGGIFGEGIDLMGDRLTGVAIAGVGLPAATPARELIRAYHEERTADGFSRAHVFPGMTRVLQAAGRLIRSETDTGALLLIDDRYAGERYRSLLPPEWRNVREVFGPDDVRRTLATARGSARAP
jgi:DNA excision repair protein ERCC-2